MSKSRSGAPRRVAAGLLAGALAVFGVALAPPAGAVDDVTTDRLAGVTRYGTAAAIAGQADFDGATTAILASGENFPDALAASGLAGANSPAPIVLTQSDSLTDETRVALSELGSLDDIIVVGGTAAVSDDVVTAVEDEGYTVTRLAGNDRYETAAAIAGDVNAGDIDGLSTALIASGEVFADALAGGPVAAAAGLPVLLVNADGIPAATEAALEEGGIEQAIILGGTARITDETATELAGITGNDAVRVAGVDRFETAALIAETLGEGELGWAPEEVHLASGLNFPDALAAGPLGGIRSAPLLLTASVPQATLDYLDENSDTIRRLFAIGGTAAVSDEDLATAETEGAEATDNDAATGGDTQTSALQGPELQSAAISGLELEELAISYTFTFDSEIEDEDDVDPGLFKLYSTDTRDAALGDVFGTDAAGDEVEVDGENVIVVFNLADQGVASATLAAVEEGAVEDENGNINPPQSVATGGIANGGGPSVVSAEVTDEDEGVIEIEFSAPQIPGAPVGNLYELVTKEGIVYGCTPDDDDATALSYSDCTVENVPDEDEPSTTIEVQFLCTGDDAPATFDTDSPSETEDPCDGAVAGDGADFSDQTLRRLVVQSIAADGVYSRINTVDLASNGTTDGADLVRVELASDNEDLEDNEALFVFDEDLDSIGTSPAAAASYSLVYSVCDVLITASPNTLQALADAEDADATYEAQDGEGFDDAVDFNSGCRLTGTSVDLADEDDFGDRAVLVTFGQDDIDNEFLTAAQVSTGAAVEDEDALVELNNDDEVELFGSQPASLFDDGEVSGPQLIEAAVEVDTTFGGDFASWVLTLTFDKDVEEDAAVAVSYWFDDGENVESDDLACEVDDDTTVVCEIDDEDSDFANATVISVAYGEVVTDDTFTTGNDTVIPAATDNTSYQFPNPEASIGVEVPEAPDTGDDD